MTAVALDPTAPPVPADGAPGPAIARRRRGRPPTVTTDRIAEAVLDIGFEGLTYASVGQRLDVSLATLFRHVRGRDELSRLGLDLAVRLHPWPALDGPWQPMLERWALSARQLWARHPGAAVEVSRGVVPPSAGRVVGEVTAALVRAGFTADDASRAVDLVFDVVADGPHIVAVDPPFRCRLRVVLAGIAAELAPTDPSRTAPQAAGVDLL